MTANKLINAVNGNQKELAYTDYMLFMEQAIINNYPKICNKPPIIKKIKRNLFF
jgi:hypothetical protein